MSSNQCLDAFVMHFCPFRISPSERTHGNKVTKRLNVYKPKYFFVKTEFSRLKMQGADDELGSREEGPLLPELPSDALLKQSLRQGQLRTSSQGRYTPVFSDALVYGEEASVCR